MNSLNTREEFCLAPKGVHAMQMSVCECVSVHAAHCALKLFNQVTKGRRPKKKIADFQTFAQIGVGGSGKNLI